MGKRWRLEASLPPGTAQSRQTCPFRRSCSQQEASPCLPGSLAPATSIPLISGRLPSSAWIPGWGVPQPGAACLSPPHSLLLSVLSSPSSDPQTGEACGHHSTTISVGLVPCSEPGTWAAKSDTPAPCSQGACVLLGPKEDNPEPRGSVTCRGAQSPTGAEPTREHTSCAPCPTPSGFLCVPGAPEHWQAGVCKSVTSLLGRHRLPGHPQLRGDGSDNGVPTSGSTTAPWGPPARPAWVPCPLSSSLLLPSPSATP